jgi:hypothetical protein
MNKKLAEYLQNIFFTFIYANKLDYLLQKFYHRNPKDDVKHIIKPKLFTSFSMASEVNFPFKIYMCSLSLRVFTMDCGIIDRATLYCYNRIQTFRMENATCDLRV